MKIKNENENEKYTLHFMFSYNKYLHIKSSRIYVMKDIKITYQLVRRQDTSYMFYICRPPFVVQLFGACGTVLNDLSVLLWHIGTFFILAH